MPFIAAVLNSHLHIVSFDVPYPADYGGVIDVFNTIQALHQLGVAIHLHCFEYGRGEQDVLKRYCTEVHYYPRSTGHKGLSHKLPYIVSSRNNRLLWERLNADEHPVLLEGIHCTYGLASGLLKKKNVFVRLHNVETMYYRQQARWTKQPIKKVYMYAESLLLKKYEKKIAGICPLIALSPHDATYYKNTFHAPYITCIPPFISWQKISAGASSASFALYFGKLSVPENEAVATWLLKEVFSTISVPLVIAGKDPSPALVSLAHRMQHTCIVENPSDADLQELIAKAQCCVIPSFTNTGVKLKLLNALFCGKHVITNKKMLAGSELDSLCSVASDKKSMQKMIQQCFETDFTDAEKERRNEMLFGRYNNLENGKKLMAFIQQPLPATYHPPF